MGPRGRFYPYLYHCDYIGLLGTGFMQVFHLGRAPRIKETLPDFLKWRRVTRRPLVFRGLTGSQRTPRIGASQITCLESSPTPSHMPKPNESKIQFSKQKVFVLENLLPNFGKYIGQPSEVNCWVILRNSHGSASEMNCRKTLQGNSLKNLP